LKLFKKCVYLDVVLKEKMKNILILILLIGLKASAQNYAKINSEFKISDSLTYETEIRIYQIGENYDYNSLFRMYRNKSSFWKVEFYEDFGENKTKINKRNLKSENKTEIIFIKLLRSHILDLPNENEIEWKFITIENITKEKTNIEKNIINEKYEYITTQKADFIGDIFKIQICTNQKSNEFEYSNPMSLLTVYPEIDELIYVSEIINLIMNEFKIWQM
jgi:hypothetical protein